MVNLLPKLQEIGRKLTKLERVILHLRKENQQLNKRVQELEKEVRGLQEEQKTTEEKYEAIKLVKSLPQHADLATVHEKIDLYLKEIDICLKNFGD
ncbi:MAG: hypothetical protein AAF587_18415 [Bacteroidota bacterium]